MPTHALTDPSYAVPGTTDPLCGTLTAGPADVIPTESPDAVTCGDCSGLLAQLAALDEGIAGKATPEQISAFQREASVLRDCVLTHTVRTPEKLSTYARMRRAGHPPDQPATLGRRTACERVMYPLGPRP